MCRVLKEIMQCWNRNLWKFEKKNNHFLVKRKVYHQICEFPVNIKFLSRSNNNNRKIDTDGFNMQYIWHQDFRNFTHMHYLWIIKCISHLKSPMYKNASDVLIDPMKSSSDHTCTKSRFFRFLLKVGLWQPMGQDLLHFCWLFNKICSQKINEIKTVQNINYELPQKTCRPLVSFIANLQH